MRADILRSQAKACARWLSVLSLGITLTTGLAQETPAKNTPAAETGKVKLGTPSAAATPTAKPTGTPPATTVSGSLALKRVEEPKTEPAAIRNVEPKITAETKLQAGGVNAEAAPQENSIAVIILEDVTPEEALALMRRLTNKQIYLFTDQPDAETRFNKKP